MDFQFRHWTFPSDFQSHLSTFNTSEFQIKIWSQTLLDVIALVLFVDKRENCSIPISERHSTSGGKNKGGV